MKRHIQKLLKVVLIIAAVLPASLPLGAQAPLTLMVEDSRGAALAGVTVEDAAGLQLGRTDAEGRLTVQCATPCSLRVAAAGFRQMSLQLSIDATVQLQPASNSEEVTVTAYRAPLGVLESPTDSRLLSQAALDTTPAITLDGVMRQLPGVELFRRSSSLVANPTSQGVSLRGLGSTSASRTLVTEDDIPLNDAFGGWIHWEEQPELSVNSIEVVRGGASDLYGSSAIGGVISNGTWTAQLTANKSVFNATKDRATFAGDYTMIFDGANGPTTLPEGDGYAYVAIGENGAVTLSGSLADGSKITPSATLSQYGKWPFYASLYGGAGCVSGWVGVGDSGAVSGSVVWIKPGGTGGNYPGGFTFPTTASGGLYSKSAGINGLNFTNAVFSGGALAGAFTNEISIGSNHKVLNLSSSKLTMTFSPSTGIFQGAVVNPAAPGSKAMPFGGVLLQNQSTALGYFLDASQSGTFTLKSQ